MEKDIEMISSDNVKFKLFVSYASSDDRDFRPVIDLLKKIENLELFIYDENKRAGEHVHGNIKEGIEKCDAGLYFHSKNSCESQYVQNEIGYLLGNNKKVFVVKLDKSPIKGMLQEINYIDFASPDHYERECGQFVKAISDEIEEKQKQEAGTSELSQFFDNVIVDMKPRATTPAVDNSYSSDNLKTVLAIVGVIGIASFLLRE